jgi:hypothetical protein
MRKIISLCVMTLQGLDVTPMEVISRPVKKNLVLSKEDKTLAEIANGFKSGLFNIPAKFDDKIERRDPDQMLNIREKPRILPTLLTSVWDATINETETACRIECIDRFEYNQEKLESQLCTAYDGVKDDLSDTSCATGSDTGMYWGCREWCSSVHQLTRTTFRYDELFNLVNSAPEIIWSQEDTCSSIQGGRRIVIQLLETKLAQQPIQTAACKFGFMAGFASVIATQQRIFGLDKIGAPLIFLEHAVGNNTRRKVVSYLWGASDLNATARKECLGFYRDNATSTEECFETLVRRWGEDFRNYTFPVPRPDPYTGDKELPRNMLPVLSQRLSSKDARGVETLHTAFRFMGQSNEDAASIFCTNVMNLTDEYLKECFALMARALRLEVEVQESELVEMRNL